MRRASSTKIRYDDDMNIASELDPTIEARMEAIAHRVRSGFSTRATILPDQARLDVERKSAANLIQQLKSHAAIELGRTLGEGGMGVVHVARQVALGREVAVKTLKEDARSEAATLKLLQEAWLTGALEHPNVVPIHDISLDENGHPRIVLKKIAGANWSQLMHDDETIRKRFVVQDPFEWNLRILMQVCNAIHFAHARGILHRDLKPDNIMIGEFGEVYVLDWGIAVSLVNDGTGRLPLAQHATEIAGTPAYMAPEMLGGKEGLLTQRTDVYLLGALLFEIIAGRPPHEGTTMMEMFHEIMRSRPRLPESTPDDLARIVLRAMDPDPDARFETAAQLRLALSGFLDHRGSLKLVSEAEHRLAEMDKAKASNATGPDEKRLRLYHLFGECRFGFLEALEIWRENARARAGLRRAISVMIEFELEENDPKAAALLMAEMEDAPSDLAHRVSEAKKFWEAEERRRTELARDYDPSIGLRTRRLIGILFGAMWSLLPFAAYFWEERHGGNYQRAIVSSIVLTALSIALAFWARDSLSRTAINRRLIGAIGVGLGAQIGIFGAMSVIGIDYELGRPIMCGVHALIALLIASTIEALLWPSAILFTMGFAISVFYPRIAYLIEATVNLFLIANIGVIWTNLRGRVRGSSDEGGSDVRYGDS